ncbi:MAG: RNHCP domain-containing protein [Chloroflexales bacterium]|nr:RNHCP domain-containing protein [Chloroflexales bacterium]
MSISHNRRGQQRHTLRARSPLGEQQFSCAHCQLPVVSAPAIAGVQNRNHCPYCLWSRHLDWREAGDRMASCRAPMEPVGLTTKRSRNKYAAERDGELMLVHRCTGCGKLAINRVAADDSAAEILALFERSRAPGPGFQAELDLLGIAILTARDGDLVRRRLFGNGAGGRAAGLARRAS